MSARKLLISPFRDVEGECFRGGFCAGLPRLVNRIARYALTAAAVKGARTVSAEHLEHAVAELRL